MSISNRALNPRELFPLLGPKFANPRDIQLDILAQLEESDNSLIMLEAPTGIGKSPIALAYGKILNSPTTVVTTATLSLQDQYMRDFPEAIELKGRANFKCTRTRGLTAAEGPCVFNPECYCDSEYYTQQAAFENTNNKVIITNYALYCSELLRGRKWFERRPHLLVCDEGHRLLDFLTTAETVTLDMKLAEECGFDSPSIDSLEEARQWIAEHAERVRNLLYASVRYRSGTAAKTRQLAKLWRQTQSFEGVPEDLVVLKKGKLFTGCPVWPTTSSGLLRNSANHILIMSATLFGGQFLKLLLGLQATPCTYLSLESPFTSARWPVYYKPVASLSKKSPPSDWERIGRTCHEIAHARPDEKGIVHVASYNQAENINRALLACGDCRGRAVSHKLGERRSDTIDRFRDGRASILVHPSVGEGESFDDEQCRFQVIAKLRYPDLGDPLVKLRADDKRMGKQFYFASTAAYTAQIAGRGMRSESDWCETYIIDGSFGNLYDRNREAFPLWFQRQLR